MLATISTSFQCWCAWLKGIQSVVKAAKECLGHNFLSFYQVLSGMCMAMHFEDIIELQAECPMVLAYSETPGTGENIVNVVALYQ